MIDEKWFSVVVRYGANDVFRPGMLYRLPEHLKQPKLARLQLRQCAYDADERIKIISRKGQHELPLQAKLNDKRLVALARLPGLFKRPFLRSKHGVGEVRLQLFPNQ